MTWIFRLIALSFIAPAIYHAVGLVRPELTEPAPASRHAVFVGVNLAVGLGFLLRPRWFVFAFAALVAQQLYSHGTIGWHVWQHEARVDWPSVIVLVTMPPLLGLLAWDAGRRGGALPGPGDRAPAKS